MPATTCPHCSENLPPALGGPGEIVDCPHCDRSFAMPGGAPRASGPRDGSAQESPAIPEPRTDVALPGSGAAAAMLTAVFYAAVVFPLRDSYFGELFAARGWVPYAIAWLSMWSAVILATKFRILRQQRRSLELDLLPRAISDPITTENASLFEGFLAGLPNEHSRSFAVRRLRAALQQFRARPDSREAVDHLSGLAQTDLDRVESAYTMVRVFIWAIPILGFIGTVLGIGTAVHGFSNSVASAVDIEVMKDSIGSVTTGLGIAFDTTLLALVMSILIMFPASSLQKSEESLLARVDAYCTRHLARRLSDGAATTLGAFEAIDSLGQRAARSLAKLDAELGRLEGTLASLQGGASRDRRA